jgi:hypothetical protein
MIGRILSGIGGVVAVVAGILSATTREPLLTHLTGLRLLGGAILIPLGVIGLIGGLVNLYGVYRGKPWFMIGGGLVGTLAPSFVSLLGVLGGGLEIWEARKSKAPAK